MMSQIGRAPRMRPALVASVVTVITVIAGSASRAAAQAVGVTTVPPDAAQASTDQLTSLLIDCGPVLGGMYVAFLIARSLVVRYKDVRWLAGWLSQGKRLAYATSALGVAYAGISAALGGGTLRAVFAAAAAAAFKLITPTSDPAGSVGPSSNGIPANPIPPAATPTATTQSSAA